MKIAIFSDSHDNVPNLKKFLDWISAQGIEVLVFCGDLCTPGTLKKIVVPKFPGPIHMVFGNVTDRELLPQVAHQFPQVTHYGDVGEFTLGGLRLAAVHYPNQAKELAATGKYDYVFYGHNHKPWEEVVDHCRVVNPGTLAGMFNKATFATLDTATGKLSLHLLERL